MIIDGYVQSPQSLYNEDESDDEDEESASEASEIEDTPDRIRSRFQVRRENIHEQQRQHQAEVEAEQRNQR